MAMIRVKPGVQPYYFITLLAAVANVSAAMDNPPEVWITSGIDGLHGDGKRSLHYALRAIDIRTHNFPTPESIRAFVAALKNQLGPDYDVLWESAGTPNSHIHAEADPK